MSDDSQSHHKISKSLKQALEKKDWSLEEAAWILAGALRKVFIKSLYINKLSDKTKSPRPCAGNFSLINRYHYQGAADRLRRLANKR